MNTNVKNEVSGGLPSAATVTERYAAWRQEHVEPALAARRRVVGDGEPKTEDRGQKMGRKPKYD